MLTDILSAVGNAASVLGFLLTIWIFFNIRTISSRYIFQGRSPELRGKLIAARKNLSEALNNNLQYVVSEALAIARSALDSLMTMTEEGPLRSDALELRRSVTALLERPALERAMSECRAVEAKLFVVIEGIDNVNKDLAWRMRNGG
jgi:hypothetical protein